MMQVCRSVQHFGLYGLSYEPTISVITFKFLKPMDLLSGPSSPERYWFWYPKRPRSPTIGSACALRAIPRLPLHLVLRCLSAEV